MTDKKVTIEITKEACGQLWAFLMNDREGTGEGYSDFILKAIDVRRQVAALTAERDALAQQLKIAEEVESYLGDKLQEEKQSGANRREVNGHLARERKKAEAERDALRVLVGRVVEGLPHSSYYQYYGDTELRQLIKDCQEALK